MKPILLTFEAFESYAEKQTIDFERLDKAGIFLIRGKTGAGKTVIFDALMYALYGELSEPQREDNDQIKTRDAGPEKKCSVTLLFEEKGKRYQIVREPQQEWKSTRKVILLKPSVTLSYLSEPEKADLTKGVDAEIVKIIGLTSSQFTQVALIAQGAFAKILTAETKDRQVILRKLFSTGIYQDFMTKLEDRLRDASDKTAVLSDHLNSIYQGIQLLSADETAKKDSLTDDQERLDFLTEVSRQYDGKSKGLQSGIRQIDLTLQGLSKERGLWDQHQKDSQDLSQKRLDIVSAQKEQEKAAAEGQQLKDQKPEMDVLHDEGVSLTKDLSQYDDLDHLSASAQEQERKISALASAQKANDAALEKAALGIQQSEKRLNEIETELQTETDVSALVSELSQKEKGLTEQEKGLRKTETEIQELNEENRSLASANKDSEEAQKRFDSLQERYYGQMSGILAKGLEDGKPCPVCGSLNHPHLAEAMDKEATKEEVEAAKKKADARNQERERISTAVSSDSGIIQKSLDDLRSFLSRFGKTVPEEKSFPAAAAALREELENLVEENRTQLSQQLAIQDRFRRLHQESADLSAQKKKAEADQITANAQKNDLAEKLSAAKTLFSAESEQARKLSSGLAYPSKAKAQERIHILTQKETEYQKAVEAKEALVRDEASKVSQLNGEIHNLEERIASYHGREAALIDQEQAEAQKQKESLQEEERLSDTALDSVNNGIVQYQKALDAGKKERENLSKLTALCFLFTAKNSQKKGSEIDRGVSLETYVLSYYLDNILVRASARFHAMTDGRYLLVRNQDAVKGSAQQGLDIDVKDVITGESRKASTLSGGETFMASLSLALGLSDYVKETTSQIKIETLFIDEGFGTLDKETLAKAVEVLSSLVQNEEVTIGLISHVDELLSTFPTRIDVTKDHFGHSSAKLILG
jgi:exonuclease SbcC